MTIRSAVAAAAQKLNTISDAPHLDAERLVLQVFGEKESSVLYAHGEKELSAQQTEHLDALIARRATGEPLAYILGEWEFYGRPFFVTPDVLIPRPETEALVEAALRYIDMWREKNERTITVADIGTGSGVIAVTLLLESGVRNQELRILATDISPAALEIARKNAQRHGVGDQIEFLAGDMLSPLAGRQIDLIVSNPPYIPTDELESPTPRGLQGKLETVGLKFEPRIALDGGPDGQKFVEQIKNAGVPALVESTNGEIISFLF